MTSSKILNSVPDCFSPELSSSQLSTISSKRAQLTSKSYLNLRRVLAIKTKPLGMILQAADLVSAFQLETALAAKTEDPNLRLGEILAQKGFIQTKTADFFVSDFPRAIAQPEKDALGYYLERAGILSEAQIETILTEQLSTGVRFGTVAVFRGFLRSTTLDFFLAHLFPTEINQSPFINMYKNDF